MDTSAAALAASAFGSFNMDFPPEVNHTAVAMLLHQFQQQEECRNSQPVEIRCDERPLNRALLGYGFLIVFCFALIGNCLNLFIYNSDQIRFYIAIRMLCTKLLMNTLMMAFLVPQAFRIINLWEPGSPSDLLYWKFWPYQAYFINVFGFCAMWLTVLMTAECYVHVFFPGQSKALCTKQNLSRSYLLMACVGLMLALIYPLNRTVSLKKHCNNFLITIVASHSKVMSIFERLHTVANLLLAIIVPLALLVFMTASIVWRLLINPPDVGNGQTAQHFSSEKRGVTRITLITTALQLITETPSVPVLIYATVFGPNIGQNMCTWQTVSHFLGLCNASLSFFVYITFSNRFRHSMIRRAQLLFYTCCPSCIQPSKPLSATGTIKNFISRTSSFRGSKKELGKFPLTNSFNSPRDSFRSELLLHNLSTPHSPNKKSPSVIMMSMEDRGRSGSTTALTTSNNNGLKKYSLAAGARGSGSLGELLKPLSGGSSASSLNTQSSSSQFDAFL